jgi:hypothetical protein
MNSANIREYSYILSIENKSPSFIDSNVNIKETLSIYFESDFSPSPIVVDSISKEPKFENNLEENNILLEANLGELNNLLKQNQINLADFRQYYTSLKDKFEIYSFVCQQLEAILWSGKFEEVSYKNQDTDQVAKTNIQKFSILTNKLQEMLTLGFIDKNIHDKAQKILMRNLASSDKRKYNSGLN